MTDAPDAAFVETREYRRFREFCDACRRYRYIGLCYGPPGVGKTLSARHYADWNRVEAADPLSPRGPTRRDDVPGNGSVFYTVKVTGSPGMIAGDVAQLRDKMRHLAVAAVRRDGDLLVEAARARQDAESERVLRSGDWYSENAERLLQDTSFVDALHAKAERCRAVADPTELILFDEADRLKVAGLEQIRDHFDRGGIGVVLIGMPGLERRLARYAQLYSRVGFVHEFRLLSPVDLRHLLGGSWRPREVPLPEGMQIDEEGVAAVIRVTGGNFRLLHRVLAQAGRILEINGLGVVTREVVEAAREVLVIGAA